MTEGSLTKEKVVIVRKPIGAIFSPGKRDKYYYLGVAWWAYPIHAFIWLFFLAAIILVAFMDYEAGLMEMSIAEILMWGFSLYVILFMLMSASRDKRLSGARKINFYFAYGSACVLKAIWISTVLFLSAMWAGAARDALLVGAIHGSVDMEVGGYWIDDLDFASSMVFWLFLYMGFAGRRAGNE